MRVPTSSTDTLLSTLSSSLDSLCPLTSRQVCKSSPALWLSDKKGNGRNQNTLTTCSLINLLFPPSLPLFLQPKALFIRQKFNPHSPNPKNSSPSFLTFLTPLSPSSFHPSTKPLWIDDIRSSFSNPPSEIPFQQLHLHLLLFPLSPPCLLIKFLPSLTLPCQLAVSLTLLKRQE